MTKTSTQPADTQTDEPTDVDTKKKGKKGDKPEAPKRVIIRAKTPMEWNTLLQAAEEQHWRKLRIEIQITDKLLAGKPANLDAATAMLKARGLDEFVATADDITDPKEKAEHAARVASDEGLCEFNRRPGKPGIWMPSNNLKAMLKENWSVLGLRMEVRGSRGALAEGLFVAGVGDTPEERDWVYLGSEPHGIHTAVAHTVGASGPVSSIKRHEFVQKVKVQFEVWIAQAKSVSEKISDDELAKTLVHAATHGTGACRSQGFGKFTLLSVQEIE